jgi:hypothetical protein
VRGWLIIIAALALCALGERAASAQSLDCSVVPQSVCADEEVLTLEGERSALIDQIADLDPNHAALAGEQAWIDGLGACGEDLACYRGAYLGHNSTLRESANALAAAQPAPPLEEPPDAAVSEEQQPSAESEPAPTPRRTRRRESAPDGQVYVPSGPPGWGFFITIGLTLLIFYWLLRKLAQHRRELQEDEAQLRGRWR